jgi:hypothetical protein
MDFVWWCMQQLKTNSLNSTLHQIKFTMAGAQLHIKIGIKPPLLLTNGMTSDSLESIRETNGNPRRTDQRLKDFNDIRAFKRATAI